MHSTSFKAYAMWKIAKPELGQLIDQLREQGYSVIGPTVADHAVVMAEVERLADLPQGYVDTQQPGQYRVLQTGHQNYFQFNVGPHSWKQYLFPPRLTVSTAERGTDGWTFKSHDQPQPKFAFLGVRACELAAIEVQDRVFLHGPYVDPVYKARREATLIIAVNCTVAASTCFCSSMNTGPKCRQLFDMALTELEDSFIVEVGSARGEALLNSLEATVATTPDRDAAHNFQQRAADQISKQLDTTNIRQLLLENLEHPRWDEVAQRCLSCTNCTQVCPTCFCSSVSEVADLTGDKVVRQREWDSCFNIDFSYMSGGVVRDDRRSRFRQWLTHKLASWHDQFETSGCVGCGRCITWCPVGIDLTEEVSAIRNVSLTQRRLPVVAETKTVCVVPQESSE
jgi:sulfhydrogenase subunit beta (sulfur reductase)